MKFNTGKLFIIGAFLAVAFTGLLVISHAIDMDEKEKAESVLVDPLLLFTSDIFKVTNEQKKNVILSPLSVHSALNLLLLGADNGSKSERELHDTLGYLKTNRSALNVHQSYAKVISHFKEIAKDKAKYEGGKDPAMDIWTMALTKGVNEPTQDYLKQVAQYYQTSVHRVDDSKPDEKTKLMDSINSWGKKAGFSNDVLTKQNLDEQFSILLMSAINVEAHWFKEFHKSTRPELFYNHGLPNQLVKNTEGLTRSKFRSSYVEFTEGTTKYPKHIGAVKKECPDLYRELADLEFRTIRIDLIGELTFTIFEPLRNGTGKELAELERKLLAVDGNGRTSRLAKALTVIDNDITYSTIQLMQMPYFKFENEIDLKDPLISMGLQSVFDSKTANLAKLGSSSLFVDKVKHKATIEVNEKGLKAAAITIVSISFASLPSFQADEPIEVLIKNPFMFVLRYKNLPLFVGHLVEV